MPARFWLGFWSAIQIFILVITDASFLVAYITRFTEECFATLISVIFIVESIQAMLHLAAKAPITPDPSVINNNPCRVLRQYIICFCRLFLMTLVAACSTSANLSLMSTFGETLHKKVCLPVI